MKIMKKLVFVLAAVLVCGFLIGSCSKKKSMSGVTIELSTDTLGTLTVSNSSHTLSAIVRYNGTEQRYAAVVWSVSPGDYGVFDVNPASSTVFTADTSKMGDGSISASYEGVMSSSITFAINKPIKGRKIMLCGNSILQSGPSPSIGWLNNHGMAASSPEKDYAHILQKNINDMFGPYEYNLFNIAPFERDCTHEPPYDYSSLFSYIINEVKRFDPDVVSLQLGENVPGAITAIGYQNALEQLITAIRTARPGVQVLLCTSFWGGVTVPGAQQAAAALHVPLVELHPLNLPQYKALDEYEHAGVAMHPNDAGMEEIANRIFSAMLTIL